MTIKATINIDDADLEAGIAQARAAYNNTADTPIDTDEEYASMLAAAGMESFRGSAKRVLAAKLEQVDDPAALAEIAVLVDAKIAEKPVPSDPAPEVKP